MTYEPFGMCPAIGWERFEPATPLPDRGRLECTASHEAVTWWGLPTEPCWVCGGVGVTIGFLHVKSPGT